MAAAAIAKTIKDHLSTQSNGSNSSLVKSNKIPFIIGVAGGTASGKTTVCNMITSQLHDQRVVLVIQDSFYRSLSDEMLESIHEYNFDHPNASDTEVLLSCMEKMKLGQAVNIPNYDFKTHKSIEPSHLVFTRLGFRN